MRGMQTLFDPARRQIFINHILDVVWPLLPQRVLDMLAYV